MKYIILAQSNITAKALHAFRQFILDEDMVGAELTSDDIIFRPAEFAHEGGIQAYQYLVQRVEAVCKFDHDSGGDDSTVVLVDCVRPLRLSAVEESVTWEKLIAMLILTFPELHWVFGVLSGEDSGQGDRFPMEDHTLKSLCKARRSRLFDPTGLRDWVREQTGKSLTARDWSNSSKTHGDTSYLPRRQESAVAIDDESAYSYLHAYTAYRFGFRASPICTFTLANELLHKTTENNGVIKNENVDELVQAWPPRIIFEDIHLNFADGKPGLSKLYADHQVNVHESKGRCEEWQLVESAEHRIFITSNQRLHGDEYKHERNKAYIEEQRALGKRIKVLDKPYAGIFKLWRQSGLARRLPHGLAVGFAWPPERLTFADNTHDHSSPGALLVVAETLIHRAEELLGSDASSVEEAVRGAVLATDALELLGGRTATIAVQAVRLKHQFELLAECQFAGVQYHLDVIDRIEDVHKEISHISKWFGRRQRFSAALNSEMHVLLDLVRVLRNYGQFDEEQVLMNRIRSIHNSLWMRQRPWRLLTMWPVLRYIEFLLGSFTRFALSLTAWILLLAGVFWAGDSVAAWITVGDTGANGMRVAVSRALESFLGKGFPNDANVFTALLYVIATIAGLLHVGAFVSLLYSNVTRK